MTVQSEHVCSCRFWYFDHTFIAGLLVGQDVTYMIDPFSRADPHPVASAFCILRRPGSCVFKRGLVNPSLDLILTPTESYDSNWAFDDDEKSIA